MGRRVVCFAGVDDDDDDDNSFQFIYVQAEQYKYLS
jgi:hypothetical protein